MQEKMITIYCLCADFLLVYGQTDDPQAKMSTAQVMTTVLVAAWFHLGNQEETLQRQTIVTKLRDVKPREKVNHSQLTTAYAAHQMRGDHN